MKIITKDLYNKIQLESAVTDQSCVGYAN